MSMPSLRIVVIAALCILFHSHDATAAETRPNIVLIMADDKEKMDEKKRPIRDNDVDFCGFALFSELR